MTAVMPPSHAQARPRNVAPEVTLDAVGDVMPGWGVAALVNKPGPDAPFALIHPIFASADAVIGNLECPLSYRGKPTKAKSKAALKARKEFLLRGPPEAATGIANAGFAAMSLANNHMMDFGPVAMRDTLSALRDAGIGTAGAGENSAQAWQPAYFERRGLKFALLSFSDVIPIGYAASAKRPGIAAGRSTITGEIDKPYLTMLAASIKLARSQADVVIVFEHWGDEFVGRPSKEHVLEAHAAIDAGARLVIGAHPHVLGPIEAYHGGLIAYTLGNFVFDTPGRNTRSAVLQIHLRGDTIQSWEAVPVEIKGGVPSPVGGRLVAAPLRWQLSSRHAYGPPE
jgi:poly-gamma-glutamate capsule biosynthesis protein CapA/YwtB (metallophosphatase superfamily)